MPRHLLVSLACLALLARRTAQNAKVMETDGR